MGYIASTGRFESAIQMTEEYGPDILLPISDRRLLIGTKSQQPVAFGADAVNQASAELSCAFFVSSRNTERMQHLASLIGTRIDSGWADGVVAAAIHFEDRLHKRRKVVDDEDVN